MKNMINRKDILNRINRKDILNRINMKDMKNLINMINMKDMKNLINMINMKDMKNLINMINMKDMKNLINMINMKDMIYMINRINMKDILYMINMKDILNMINIKNRKDMIYTKRTKFRKGRCSRGREPDGTPLFFGRYGTQSCRAGRRLYRAIEAARRATTKRNAMNWVIVLNLSFNLVFMKALTRVISYLILKILLVLIFGYLADPWQIVQNVLPGGDVVIYQAPSPGGPVEIFEVPLTPQDQAVEISEVQPTPPQDQAVEASLNQGPDWNRNLSLESSLQGRIRNLEREDSMFLLEKEKGEYWRNIKADLEGVKSPMEYATRLDVESLDLSIRELRHACVRIMEEELNLLGSSAAFPDYFLYFEDQRLDLESALKLTRGEDTISPEIAEHAEIQFLQNELKHLRKLRFKASFFKKFKDEYL